MDTEQAIREFWDEDAATYNATYNDTEEHYAGSIAERAAWAAALDRYLPPGGPPGPFERMFGVTPNFVITAG